MTPKEKAEELTGRYAIKSYQLKLGISFDFDKQCALIAVDEILCALSDLCCQSSGSEIIEPEIDYWQEVKKEIELM